jgi:hypothetical protein
VALHCRRLNQNAEQRQQILERILGGKEDTEVKKEQLNIDRERLQIEREKVNGKTALEMARIASTERLEAARLKAEADSDERRHRQSMEQFQMFLSLMRGISAPPPGQGAAMFASPDDTDPERRSRSRSRSRK